jgi:hypothetical protein
MTNIEKYNKIFMNILGISEDELGEDCIADNVEAWDSVGQMNLISEIEESFDIVLEDDEVLALRSYEEGIRILQNHNIEL